MGATSKAPSKRGASNSHAGTGGIGRDPRVEARDADAARALGRERVIEIQRARLLSALCEVSAERGAGNVAVAHIVERAGVSRRTFYALFADREECFLAAFDDAIAGAQRCVSDVYDSEARWVERIRTGLIALLDFLDTERGAGELLVVGSLGAGPEAVERRQRVLAQLAAVVDEGRAETKAGSQPPPLTAEGVVGGVLSVVHTHLLASLSAGIPNGDTMGVQGDSLLELAGLLTGMIVLPYLGPAAARRELERPIPKRKQLPPTSFGDPLRDVGMRLTYRTVRVLMSIAAKPGSSNREVGVGAGMEDQGQISKLLARLQKLELIQNTCPASARGAPNAWGLTERGWDVQRAMAGQRAHG
jgi:AcrR family transcriptional regulator